MEWTEQRIETLRKLWGQGQTASQIAAILGGITRNAVIGKAHRLGLTGRPSPIKREAGSGNSQPRRKTSAGRQERPLRAAPPLSTTGSNPSAAGLPSANATPSAVASTHAAGTLPPNAATGHGATPNQQPRATSRSGLGSSAGMSAMSGGTSSSSRVHAGGKNCSWPVGDPKQPGFHFCGEPAEPGRPYCAHHCHVAYHRKSEAA